MKKSILALAVATVTSFSSYGSDLENIQVDFLKNNNSILMFDFDDKAPSIEEFQNENGIIHFKVPNSKSLLSSDNNNLFEIGENGINNVNVKERGNYLYFYISTSSDKKALYSNQNDRISLTLKNKDTQNVLTHEDFENITMSKSDIFIEDVRFKKENNNQVRLDVSYDLKDSIYEIVEHDKGFTLFFDQASIPSRLFKNSDLSSFNLPVESYLTKIEDGQVKIDVIYNDDFKSNYIVTTSENSLSVIVKGARKSKVVGGKVNYKKTEQKFEGELVSFNFQGMEVESALMILAEKMGLNLVVGDNVSGQISLILKNVPHDQALDVILKTKGLDKVIEGNIMIVAPMEEIAQRREFELTSENKIKTIKPLKNEEIQINYAKVSDVQVLLNGMKSNRGSIMIDERTNKVFVEDIDEKIVSMKKMVESVDVPIRQVSVEARIVFAKKTAGDALGVRWKAGLQEGEYSDNYNSVGGSDNVGIGVGSVIGSLGDGASTAAITLGFANANVEATLNAMESAGDIEIVARPLVIAADKQTSSIASGQEYPYREIDDEGETTTSFKEIVLSLDVTPQITPDDKLILDLAIVQDSISAITEAGPAVDTTNINSRVIVDNKETLVLGGVFKEDLVTTEEKVPLLGDIPFLGNAFRYKGSSQEEVELLIFITPTILNGEQIISK